MPFKKNWNSRDDKSAKMNKPAKTGGAPYREKNTDEQTGVEKKKFGSQHGRPFKPSSSGAFKSGNRDFPKPNNPYSKPRPDHSDKSFERKPYGERNKPDHSAEKPYGSKPRDNRYEGKLPSGRAGDNRSADKPHGNKTWDKRPEGKPYRERSANNQPPERTFDNKPANNRNEGRPYRERSDENRSPEKPFAKKTWDNRPESGEKKRVGNRDGNTAGKSSNPRTDTNYRPYQPERKFNTEGRKWSSEETLKKVTRSKKPVDHADDSKIRLNRFIANAGICSRRKADELIAAGVVSVNGEPVTELGFKVDPAKDLVRYNGEALKREKMVYVLLNKPKDYITTTDDPQERKTVMNLVEKASRERIYPVGRLDRNTTGLLLMTNDGDLAEKLSHPRNNVTKIYQVELNRNVPQGDLNKIAFGLELEDGLIKPDQVSYVTGGSKNEIGIQIHSGKNRIVRRIFEHLGYEVVKLDRVVYSSLTKKDLPRGHWRYLEQKEIIQLKHLIK